MNVYDWFDNVGNGIFVSSVGNTGNTTETSSVQGQGQAPPPNNNLASAGGVSTSPNLGVTTDQVGNHVYNQENGNTLFDYNKTNFDDLLLSLQSWIGTQITDLFALLGINDPNDLTRSAIEDWNKQLVETIMSLLLQFEQRNYDREVLLEQRQYDDPTNQLARLMAAGISRDAALQMLGQGSGSGGSGTAQSAQVSPGIPASQSHLNQVQQKTAIANTIFNGIGAIGSLVNAGIGIAQAVPAMRIANAQSYMSQQQVAGYNAANTLAGNILSAVSSGQLDKATADGWSNASDFEDYVHNNPDSHIAKLCAQDGSYAGTFGSIYGRESLNNLWKSRRDSQHAGEILQDYIQSQKLQNFRLENDIKKVAAELDNINADTLLKTEQSKKVLAEICQINANTDFIGTQTDLLELQQVEQDYTNKNLASQFELNSEGFPILKQIYLDELNDKLLEWSCITDPKGRDARIAQYIYQSENARALAYLENIRLNSVGSFAENHPKLYGLCQALGVVGSQYASSAANGAKSFMDILMFAIKATPK